MTYAIKSVTVRCVVHDDPDSSPTDYLFQDPDYREVDQERLGAFNDGRWSFVGVQAVADIELCLASCPAGSAGHEKVTSGGLWAIESDIGSEYLAEVYAEEVADLKERLVAMGIVEDSVHYWTMTVEPVLIQQGS